MKKDDLIMRLATFIMMMFLALKINLTSESSDTFVLVVNVIFYILTFLNIILAIYYFIKKKNLNS